jgi:hypothetical protein
VRTALWRGTRPLGSRIRARASAPGRGFLYAPTLALRVLSTSPFGATKDACATPAARTAHGRGMAALDAQGSDSQAVRRGGRARVPSVNDALPPRYSPVARGTDRASRAHELPVDRQPAHAKLRGDPVMAVAGATLR